MTSTTSPAPAGTASAIGTAEPDAPRLPGTSRTHGGAAVAALVAPAVPLALAAASWVVALWEMGGAAADLTGLGPFVSFIAWWMPMTAAMMLPGAAPAIRAHVRTRGRMRAAPLFAGTYLAVWTLAGVAVYAAYALGRPHGPIAAGVMVIAAGGYACTPLAWRLRRRCGEGVRSGFEYGLYCVGSGIGLMAVLIAVGAMSAAWMLVITVLAVAQKLLPPKAAIDVPTGLAVAGLGLWIVLAPSSVPGLMPPM